MSNKVSFETRKPIALDSQIKSFGTHKDIPMSNKDAYRVIAAGVTPVLTNESGEKVELTFENLDENIVPGTDVDGNPPAPSKPGDPIVTINGYSVYLNGTPGVIKLNAKDGKTYLHAVDSLGYPCIYPLTASTTIYGGSLKASVASTSITMESGTIAEIYGGGEGGIKDGEGDANVTGTAKIVVKGGTLTNVIGGSCLRGRVNNVDINVDGASLTAVQGGGMAYVSSTQTVGTQAAPQDSPCIVDNAIVVVGPNNKFPKDATIFGGGQSYSYTKKAKVTVNGADVTKGWVTSGGSNGRTDDGELIINGGKYNIVQSINRGSMIKSTTTINGGTFTKVFAGSEDPESVAAGIVNGVIAGGSIKLDIKAGTIKELHIGSSGKAAIPADSPIVVATVAAGVKVTNLDAAKTEFGKSLTIA